MRTGLLDVGSKFVHKFRLLPSNPPMFPQEEEIHRDVDVEGQIRNLENECTEMLSDIKGLSRSVEGLFEGNAKVLSETLGLRRRINKTSETLNKLVAKNKELRTMIYSLKPELNACKVLEQQNQARLGVLEGEVAKFGYFIEKNRAAAEERGDSHIRTPTKEEDPEKAPDEDAVVTALEGVIVQNRWRLGKKLGVGAGGLVCEAMDIIYQAKRAAKLEVHEGTTESSLLREYRVYEILHRQNGLSGFARVHFFGTCGPFNVLILDFLGLSLLELCQPRIDIGSVLKVGIQCLDRIEILHQNNIVHRDIKPENLLTGVSANGDGTIHLIDFGLASFCRDPAITQSRSLEEELPFIGTVCYASIAAHKGQVQTRKDDLESLGYVLIKLINGSLPWESARGANMDDLSEKTLQLKQIVSLKTLCQGLPAEFLVFMQHVRNLSFTERPDYEGLRFLLFNAQHRQESND